MEAFKKAPFKIVDDPKQADFVIDYRTLSQGNVQGLFTQTYMETGQMDVYFYRNGKKVLAWTESKRVGQYQKMASMALAERLVNHLKKKGD